MCFTNYATCDLSLPILALSLAIPALSLGSPALSLAIPILSLSIMALSLAVPGIPCHYGVILGFTPVEQENYIAALLSLSLTKVKAGANLNITGIKQGLLLIKMVAMT